MDSGRHWVPETGKILCRGSTTIHRLNGQSYKLSSRYSLTIATRTEQVPIDFELYLPVSWAEDVKLRDKARIPDAVKFRTTPQLALEMMQRALDDGVPPGVVLNDVAYGSSDFRAAVRSKGLHYSVGDEPQTKVRCSPFPGDRTAPAFSVKELALRLHAEGHLRRCTWRGRTKEDLSAKFVMRRVSAVVDDVQNEHESVWLLVEWRDRESGPANYFYIQYQSAHESVASFELLCRGGEPNVCMNI